MKIINTVFIRDSAILYGQGPASMRMEAAQSTRLLIPACGNAERNCYDKGHSTQNEFCKGKWLKWQDLRLLIFAGHAAAASGTRAATSTFNATGRPLSGLGMPASFCNGARAAADEPFHTAAAVRALGDWRVRHLLAPFKMAAACCALVLVGGHILHLLQITSYSIVCRARKQV